MLPILLAAVVLFLSSAIATVTVIAACAGSSQDHLPADLQEVPLRQSILPSRKVDNRNDRLLTPNA